MNPGGRLPANLATLANAAVGVGAIAYLLAGNKLWAMLLIIAGVGFDGLDGLLSRRAGGVPSRFGRIADSVADAATFGLAPAALIVIHTDRPVLWGPYALPAELVAVTYAALALARLTYFTARGYQRPHFVGAPTPQAALAVIAFVLVGDVPAFLGTNPPAVLVGAAIIAITMVLPIPFPKIRRGSSLRAPMTATGVALMVSIVPLQFRLAAGSPFYLLSEAATGVGIAGLLVYYFIGPWTVPPTPAVEGAPHG